MKKLINISIFLLVAVFAQAQTVRGTIVNESYEALVGASAVWAGTTDGTISDIEGKFELIFPDTEERRLVISYVGYQTDTFPVRSNNLDLFIQLNSSLLLDEVVVNESRPGQYISNTEGIKTEVITELELKKEACCDLAGCFNTNASVESATTNIVTQTKELRILGLNGVYNQVLIDGMPLVHGLSYTYGISSVPGPLVKNIFVSKGANSVLQGWESISGQINVITQKLDDAPKLLVNIYGNSFGETQYNTYHTFGKSKWKGFIGGHMALPAQEFDRDEDNFLDLPKLNRYELFNKWQYGNKNDKGFFAQFGARWFDEKRVGGQVNYNPKTDEGSSTVYGQHIKFNQTEASAKVAYKFSDRDRVMLLSSGQYHDQNSWFGWTNYDAHQYLFNSTLQYELTYENQSNLKIGGTYRYLDLVEDIRFVENPLELSYAGLYKNKEMTYGLFAENTLYFGQDKFTLINGVRLDHSTLYGTHFTPRSLLKYSPNDLSSIRASVGLGWRSPHIFSNYVTLLASQRDIVFVEQLDAEKAMNWGINYTTSFDLVDRAGSFSADYYQTRFQNQIFPDYHSSHTEVLLENYRGKSVSNGIQVEVRYEVIKNVELKSAYNYLEVYRMDEGQKMNLPFIPKHKFLQTVSYKFYKDQLHWNASMQWYGKQYLPTHHSISTTENTSDAYATINTQISLFKKRFEWYAGCENIFDFRQERPIISWEDPFSPYFDTSSVWGPTKGREFYIGMRFILDTE